MITTLKCVSFLTPDMASKKDAGHGIDCSLVVQHDAMYSIIFYTMSGVKKLTQFHAVITCPDSACSPPIVSMLLSLLINFTIALYDLDPKMELF